RKNQRDQSKNSEPKRSRCDDAVLIGARKLEVTLQPAWLQFERARFVTGDLQVGGGLWMMPVQRKRTLVIQNSAAKITGAKISVAQIVKQICVPLARANQRFVTGDRFFEMALREFLVCLGELRIGLRKR